ncbi:efflux RND transporter periplasmic adaptor subunit [Pseudomonas sp. PHC1]|uniref:efflux RND transporter periplasmic adaptor subunit n=1 Tax=Pseudomonas sp. PHC1 TaxID=3384759 RepID=UPI00396F6C67
MPKKIFSAALIALSLILTACGKAPSEQKNTPLATVRIETVEAQVLPIHSELSGRIVAPRIAEVRARVPGVVMEQNFREGSDVKKGEVLFRIDPAPLNAELDSAQAKLRKAQASAVQARLQVQRYTTLIESNAISRQEYDNAISAAHQTNADVSAKEAAVAQAKLNLSYATVIAPISGRVGRALVTEGALVGEGESTPLALIQQLDPIYADLSQSTRELNELRKAFRSGQMQQVGHDQVKATLVQDDGNPYPLGGRLLFSDISVDSGTGQVIVRSEFPNPNLDLLPGSFVRVRLEQAINQQGISVPQRAIQRDSAGVAQVLLLDANDQVAQKAVQLGPVVNNRWVVIGGLNPGDRIIVEGLQHARAGEKVLVDNTPS